MVSKAGELGQEEIDSLVALIRNWKSLNETELAQLTEEAVGYGPGQMGMGQGMMWDRRDKANQEEWGAV